MLYCFLGIAIIADIFMCSIEKITSATKKVKIVNNETTGVALRDDRSDNGQHQQQYREEAVWNSTVANLTLMVSQL
jgi:solute carrier family 8 (sodium/calcium exchanger)